MMVDEFGNGDTPATSYDVGSWAAESDTPELSHSVVIGGTGITRPHYFINEQEVSKDEYETSLNTRMEVHKTMRREREFPSVEDAFAYAATLTDGVVLDWGRCYAAMEREGLKIGFVIDEWKQPIVTPEDLLVRPGPSYILARDIGGLGSCCTDFTDDSKSWSEAEVEVIEDGTEHYGKGQLLRVRVSPNMGARPSVGRDWRMKLLRLEDVVAVLPTTNQTGGE